ncbi:helix-turn-helix transcriptional regulator [Acutalibacter sp. JLR.KK004]|mgnify:FL=1|uniref:helix-turn-helix domain-containing protein n=1 Tax=Acutalibacter sp. JLR.KK004 TaxID=3112622 RepID=UPI002FEEC7A8
MLQRIKDLREDHDLFQKDVAAYLQCSQVCYSRYERGDREIPLNVLIKLSQLYNTSTDYLLGLTDEPKPYPRRPPKKTYLP